MGNLTFRPLRADEVDVRVAQCKKNGVSLLLYKDARCDMNILDETVGPARWQRHHSRDNANCTVSIYFPSLDQWVEKEDTGTESNTEAEKGLASDSFKRACFNWGIGRELYTAPFIWVRADDCTIQQRTSNSYSCSDRFRVASMAVEDGKITALTIANDSRKGAIVFRYGTAPQPAQEPQRAKEVPKGTDVPPKEEKPAEKPAEASMFDTIGTAQVDLLNAICMENGINPSGLCAQYKVKRFDQMTNAQYENAMARISKWVEKGGKK